MTMAPVASAHGSFGGVAMLGLVLALAHAPADSLALTIDITALMPMSNAELRTMVQGSTTPDNTLLLSVDAVVEAVERVKWQNRNLADLPTDTRGYLIGRALGRVLAHEVGHYLLAWRVHTRDGLMRPAFRADQLIALSRKGFALSKTQVPLARLRVAQLASRPRELARNRDSSPSQAEP